ncbi:MAG TPA: hydrogenase 2 operon protein HybA [Candidatus Binatia bacterium]|jgi:formate dehydrogenase beta subunit
MGISRRSALKALAGAAGSMAAAAVVPSVCRASSGTPAVDASGYDGMLYDATRCIGCKACMVACNEANDLEPDTGASSERWQMPLDLNEHTKNIIKCYRDETGDKYSFVKRQCMHCIDPACAAACMIGALAKREHGIVTYQADLCVGCRYCEMACPFNVPKFEWSSLAGKIVKCELCKDRIAVGKQPACTEVCPTHAVIYGKRGELLAEAHRRLEEQPERYVKHVYGEHEVGGTQVLYLAGVDFDLLGLPAYGDEAAPARLRSIQETIYQGFTTPFALYAVLAGVMWKNRRTSGDDDDRDEPASEEESS